MTIDKHSWIERIEWEPHNDKPDFERAFDEIVVKNPDSIHIERMDDNHYWMAISKGDERQVVNFFIEYGQLVARTEAE